MDLKNDPNEVINGFFFDIFSEYFKYEEDMFLFSIVILNFILLITFLLIFFIFIVKMKNYNRTCKHIISYWQYRYKNYDNFYKWMEREFPEKKSITDEEIDILLNIDNRIEKFFSTDTLKKLVTPKDSKIIKDEFINQMNKYRYNHTNIDAEEKQQRQRLINIVNKGNIENFKEENYIIEELKKKKKIQFQINEKMWNKKNC